MSGTQAERMAVYVGTYTGGGSRGIYVGDLDPVTGGLTLTGTAGFTENPSYLAVDPLRFRLYAVSEVEDFDGQNSGAVSAFALDPVTGSPTLLNTCASGGTGPCHLSVDPEGRFVLVANYAGGSVALLPLRGDGGLAGTADVVAHRGASTDPERQSGPHAHFITLDPEGRYALAVDLGTDSLEVYETDAARGRLIPKPDSRTLVKPGAGPRHLAFHPSGRFVYVTNELDSTLTVWLYDAAQGRLSAMQTLSTLPAAFAGPNAPGGIRMHPSGRFLYGSNRGHDSIAIFSIDAETGRASLLAVVPAGGRNPRGFAIDPTGACLVVAHQDSGTVVSFLIDPATGDLAPTGRGVQVPDPACVEMLLLPG